MLRYQVPSPHALGEHPMKVRNLPGFSGLGYIRRPSPFTYRPLGMELSPRAQALVSLGEGGPARPRLGEFSIGRLPNAILFMVGGVAGLYVSEVFPTPANVIVKAAGVMAVGWGIYHLFGEPTKPPPAVTPAGVEQEPQKTPSMPAFMLISGSIVSPVSGTKPDLNVWTWTRNFDVIISWYNGSSEKVNFTYDVLANIVASPGVPIQGETWIARSVYTGTVKLDPGTNSPPDAIAIPVVEPPKQGLTGRGMGPSVFYMDLQLRKFDKQGNPVLVGDQVRVGPFEFA